MSAGVRIFCYLDDRELTVDSAADKLYLAIGGIVADMEREKARQRTRDAMERKASKGYVTGGTVFGYVNVEIRGDGGVRQHVERQVDPDQAVIVRRIFQLAADGAGYTRIAKLLNDEGVPSPRPRRSGRPRTWVASSVRGVLFNPIYRGQVVWGRKAKRDKWGVKRPRSRPKDDWIVREDPALRIVSDDLWTATHDRIAGSRKTHSGVAPRGAPARFRLREMRRLRRADVRS